MLGIATKPPKSNKFFYIKLGRYYIYSDNRLFLACIWNAYSKIGEDFRVWVIKFRLGQSNKVILIDFPNLEISELNYEDFEAIKLNYPYFAEFECPIENIQVDKIPIKRGSNLDLKKLGIYGGLIIVAGFIALKLWNNNSRPVKPVSKPVLVPKIVAKKKPIKKTEPTLFCVGNIRDFVRNYILGAKVEQDNKTEEVEMFFVASNGKVYKTALHPTVYQKVKNLIINYIPGISFITKKEGVEFMGNDYDLCLDFIRQNSDKPLYITKLDEKGCDIWILRDCFKLAGNGK